MKNSWHTRYRMPILTGLFLSLIALFISTITIRLVPVRLLNICGLVIFRIIGTNRFSLLLRWRFLPGIGFGFVGGPTYLICHLLQQACESQNWSYVSDGANISMAAMGTIFAFGSFFPFHLMFAWLYGSSILLLHAIRSSRSDRLRRRYGLNGFAAGMLFELLGTLFKRCFPEANKDEQARDNFLGGLAFGLTFLLTVVNLISFHWRQITI